MADGNFGERDIVLDLNDPITARTLRAATQVVKVVGITINGNAPTTGSQGNIVLRKELVSTGPIVWELLPTTNQQVNAHFDMPGQDGRIYNGLFMDAMTTNGWDAGSVMIIHTA
jgi:hypothetical protein